MEGRESKAPARHRSFDPRAVGETESAAWIAYYRRDWLRFGYAGVTLARRTFGLSWPATIASAWLVLRANQLWAPFPDNSPMRAQRAMERFFRIVKRHSGEAFEPAIAARLEVQWWRVHRDLHHHPMAGGEELLIDAIAALYAYVYGVPATAVQLAAAERVLAMRYTDRWVQRGCRSDSPLVDQAREALIRSYTALLSAVQTPRPARPRRSRKRVIHIRPCGAPVARRTAVRSGAR